MEWILKYMSWVAVISLSLGYWTQVYRIHLHKEVRDLALPSYVLMSIGFAILFFQAVKDESTIFIAKQIAVFVPVTIIIFQIIIHRKDKWHDSHNPECLSCKEELEMTWKICPYCGTDAPEFVLLPEFQKTLDEKKQSQKQQD